MAQIPAIITRGHRVASGLNGDPRFPGGTLKMQEPHFLGCGVDLRPFHPGTLNVSIAPMQYRVGVPKVTLRNVRWHPTEPAEDFSFFDAVMITPDHRRVSGLIYYPHPETKPEHFQQPDVLELLMPTTPGLDYGTTVELEVPAEQMTFVAA